MVSFKVHANRAVIAAFLPRPIVYPDDAWFRTVCCWLHMHESQQGPRADWHGQLMRETRTTLSTSRKRKGEESVVQAHGASCVGRERWAKGFGKRFAVALCCRTEEAAHL